MNTGLIRASNNSVRLGILWVLLSVILVSPTRAEKAPSGRESTSTSAKPVRSEQLPPTEFSMERTAARIHLIDSDHPVEVEFPGSVASPHPVTILITRPDGFAIGGPRLLYREDVHGQAHDIEITPEPEWVLKVNGQDSHHFVRDELGRLAAELPPGPHLISIVMRHDPGTRRPPGYYTTSFRVELAVSD